MESKYPAIEILMIDDDPLQMEALKNFAAIHFKVMLCYARSLEEGIKQLQQNPRILAIILDGKGVIHQKDSDAEATEAFVHEALTEIALLEKRLNRVWSKCVLTAWYDYLLPGLKKRVQVFDKKMIALEPQRKREMFNHLLERTQYAKEFILRQKYKPILQWMDNDHFPTSADKKVFESLVHLENGTASQEDFNSIRSLYELLLKQIKLTMPTALPDILFHRDGRPNLEWTLRYLAGQDIFDGNKSLILTHPTRQTFLPKHVLDCFYFIKNISSTMSHDSEDCAYTDPYIFAAAINAWTAIFNWYITWKRTQVQS
jgi:hypothetical protein